MSTTCTSAHYRACTHSCAQALIHVYMDVSTQAQANPSAGTTEYCTHGKETLCILLEINVLAEWTYILLQTQTDTQEEINPQHRVLLDPIHSCGSHLPPLLPFPLPTFPTTPWKHPNHPASTGMWTLCLVHLLLSLSFSLTPSLRCLLYFHPCASTLLAFG